MENATPASNPAEPKHKLFRANSIAFLAMHLVCLVGIWVPLTKTAAIMGITLYWVRMFGITAGYHRYFAHRSYKTNRVFQFILALIGASAAQKGPLWWAGNHRIHHKYSDTEKDIHSRWYGGWYWSHMGWILSEKWEPTPTELIQDFNKYPELRWLNNNLLVPPMLLGIASYLIGGWSGLIWGFFVSTVVLYHCTFTINSIMHTFGRQRYVTGDTSRNNWFFALLTMGEGWHNNHHYYQASARQGFYWWELDFSYYILKALSWVGIVSDLKEVPLHVREANQYAPGDTKILKFDPKTIRLAASRAATSASEYAHQAAEAAREAAHRAKEAADEAVHRWAEAAREAATKASEAASEATARAKESASLAAAHAATSAQQAARRWSETASEAAANAAAAISRQGAEAGLA